VANRYFVEALPDPGPFRLAGTMAHHLGTVLRLRPGAELCLADGRGGSALATVQDVSRREVEVLVGTAKFTPRGAGTVRPAGAAPGWRRQAAG
jgi:16S rRNA U1498 N3-methylase RsmE